MFYLSGSAKLTKTLCCREIAPMKRRFALWGLLMLGGSAFGQNTSGLYTRPTDPSPDALARLNLKKAWSVHLPIHSQEDGVVLVQPRDTQVFVQLRSSTILALDSETGRLLWRFAPARPYQAIQPLAVSSKYLFFTSGLTLYVLDRATGRLRFDEELPATSPTGPVADNELVIVPLSSNRIVGFVHDRFIPADPVPLPPAPYTEKVNTQGISRTGISDTITSSNRSPSISVLSTLKPPYALGNNDRSPSISVVASLKTPYRLDNGGRSPSLAIRFPLDQIQRLSVARREKDGLAKLFTQEFDRALTYPPILVGDRIFSGTANGLLYSTTSFDSSYDYEFSTSSGATRKYPLDEYQSADRAKEFLRSSATISAAISVDSDHVYVPTAGADVYSVAQKSGKVDWLYTAPSGVDRKPFVTADGVYLGGSSFGLIKVDTKTGERLWLNKTTSRVIAVNPKYVYARSAGGKLLVLDPRRGTELGSFDASQFSIPIVNDYNDRIYLTANNGLLVSLYDPEFPVPISPLTLKVDASNREKVIGIEVEKVKKDLKKEAEAKKDDQQKKDFAEEDKKKAAEQKEDMKKAADEKKEQDKKDAMKKDDDKKVEPKKVEAKKDE